MIQAKTAQVEFTKEEAGELLSMIDKVIKYEGLKASAMGMFFFNKITEAFKAKKIEKPKGGKKNV